MQINNTPIIGKFLIIIAFFGLLSVGSTIFSATNMQAINDGYSDAANRQGIIAVQLAKANRTLIAMRAAISGLEIANTDELDAISEQEIKESRMQFVKFTDEAKRADTSNTYKVEAFAQSALDLVDNVCAKAIKMGKTSTTPETVLASQAEFIKVCNPPFKPLVDEARSIVDRAIDDEKRLDESLSAVTATTIHITYFVVFLGLALVATLAWYALKAWVSTPIARLTNTMLRLAAGDLSIKIEGADRRDEIGRMTQAVQVFKDNGIKLKSSEESAAADRKQADAERARTQALQAAHYPKRERDQDVRHDDARPVRLRRESPRSHNQT